LSAALVRKSAAIVINASVEVLARL